MANLSNTDWGNSPTKTGLYKVTIDYSYIDPDSNWWVTPSCTYCAFTDKEKARQFAINKIKEEGWDYPKLMILNLLSKTKKKTQTSLNQFLLQLKKLKF